MVVFLKVVTHSCMKLTSGGGTREEQALFHLTQGCNQDKIHSFFKISTLMSLKEMLRIIHQRQLALRIFPNLGKLSAAPQHGRKTAFQKMR